MKKLLRLLIAILILPIWVIPQIGWSFILIVCVIYAWLVNQDFYKLEIIYYNDVTSVKYELIKTWTSLYRWVKQ